MVQNTTEETGSAGVNLQKAQLYKKDGFTNGQNWSTCPHFVVYDNNSKGDNECENECNV